MNVLAAAAAVLVLSSCQGPAPDTTLVISRDPELRKMVAELLPGLAERSGLELTGPVRVERRSREDLERYLVAKLDEEMSEEDEDLTIRSYALLGLVPPDLNLRELLLSVYTEQVAGFYDPDSTALFVLDDQPAETLEPLLIHELVHAVQDQAANLDSLTDKDRGNDRSTAAQAAIEGHATLVMLEYMMTRAQGAEVDLSELPDFAGQLRPALEAVRGQYPVLASAPRMIQESVLFPYLEGAGFVQALWTGLEGRPAPFGPWLPQSTEQILEPERLFGASRDDPTEVSLTVAGGTVLHSDGLGQFETGLFLQEVAGAGAERPAAGWDGDRYVLVDVGGSDALAWATVWDDAAARNRFVEVLRPALDALPLPARVEAVTAQGREVALVRVGPVGSIDIVLETSGSGSASR